jgi:lysophospholipase L1-like esterase
VANEYGAIVGRLGPWWARAQRGSLLLLTATERYIFWRINQSEAARQDPTRRGEVEAAFRRNITESVRALRRKGTKVLLIPEVLMARRFGSFSADYEKYTARYATIPGILKSIADEEGCEFLDLQPAFAFDDYERYFVDPVHLTNEGNGVLSHLIVERSRTLRGLTGASGTR